MEIADWFHAGGTDNANQKYENVGLDMAIRFDEKTWNEIIVPLLQKYDLKLDMRTDEIIKRSSLIVSPDTTAKLTGQHVFYLFKEMSEKIDSIDTWHGETMLKQAYEVIDELREKIDTLETRIKSLEEQA